MFVALAVVHRRQRVDGHLGRQLLQRMSEQQRIDKRVRRQLQLIDMLLNRSRGLLEQRRLAWQPVDLLPVQISEIANVRNPSLHRGAPLDVVNSSTRKVIIFPGFSSPLGS